MLTREFILGHFNQYMKGKAMSTEQRNETQSNANGGTVDYEPAEPSATDFMAALAGMKDNIAAPPIHNFNGTPLEMWRMAAIARGPECKDAKAAMGRTFLLSRFYIHPVCMPGKMPGELIDAVRVVLFDDQLVPYAFVSGGIADSMSMIFQFAGRGPWNPPLSIRIVESVTRSKNRIYSIVPE